MIDTSTLLNELREMRQKVENIGGIFDLDKVEGEVAELEKQMSSADFWQDQEKARRILQERNILKQKINAYSRIASRLEEAHLMAELAADENDEAALNEITVELSKLRSEVKNYELSTLLNGEYDVSNAILSIQAGAGGTEAQDWVDMLLRMYLRWTDMKGFETSITDTTPGEEAGTKSVTALIRGDYAYGFLRAEKGVHRLVRISPFDSNKRRHTSFASVEVIPEIADEVDVEIKPDEIRIDTYRSSGAGGQHVNKTDSAVRITHIPTGIVVQCQNERSQHKNKENAMRILRSRLFEVRRKEQAERISELQGELKDIAWGSQIRSYVFQPYTMVKDLRTRYETGNIQAVMDGEIDEFIWEYLKKETTGDKK
ncbi:MAG: peptide chain release factor 2 [bacterium]